MSTYRIVIGTDGSADSQYAVAKTADLAARLSAEVVVVHAFEPLDHLEDLDGGQDLAEVEAATTRRLEEEWTAPLVAMGVATQTRVAHGLPADVLCDVADEFDADLIVVGARGLGRFESLLLGSTSSRVVNSSTRPVLVIPPGRH